MHGHSGLSDGRGSPDAYYRYARDEAKLDFAILTDHDFGPAPPWHLTRENWNLIQDAADAWTQDGQFVAIAGYEWTSAEKYWSEPSGICPGRPFAAPTCQYNHKNVYFLERVPDIFRACDAPYRTPDLLAAVVAEAGGLIHNNHPSIGPEGRN